MIEDLFLIKKNTEKDKLFFNQELFNGDILPCFQLLRTFL